MPKDIAEIITGSSLTHRVNVATTRVPSFFDNMRNPLFGYRLVGRLSAMDIQFVPPAPCLDSREIFALQSNRKTTQFVECWSPYGLTFDKHFIIIFSLSSTPSLSHQSSPSPYSQHDIGAASSASQSLPSLASSSSLPPAASTTIVVPTTATFRTPSPLNSVNGSSTNKQPRSDGRKSGVNSVTSRGDTNSQGDATGVAGSKVTIETLCIQSGVAASTIAAAKFNKGDSLLPMVLNHRAMSSVLIALKFQDGDSPPSKGKMVTFHDSMQLSAENVLRAFNWTHESYKHKCKWYFWAEEAAQHYEWRGPTPGECDHILFT